MHENNAFMIELGVAGPNFGRFPPLQERFPELVDIDNLTSLSRNLG